MNVYILTDVEGACGVDTWDDETGTSRAGSPRRMALAAAIEREANAAVAGALDAGARRIVVRDGHGYGDTIRPEFVQAPAELEQGNSGEGPLPRLDASFHALLMVGQHASAGNPRGCLAHTYSRRIRSIHVNTIEVGEIELAAGIAAERGVPTVFVSGDSEAVAEARRLMPALHCVETKESVSRLEMKPFDQDDVCNRIRATVRASLLAVGPARPLFGTPVTLSVRYRNPIVPIVRLALRPASRACQWRKLPRLVYRRPSLEEAWLAFAGGAGS